jgi:hypothetical protein
VIEEGMMNKARYLKLVIVLALGLMTAALVVLVGVDPWHLGLGGSA